jgi:hypothetical protein
MSWQEAFDLALLPQLRHAWTHHSDMLTVTSLTIWLHWEEAVCGAFWFADTGETNVAGSMEPKLAYNDGLVFAGSS